MLFTNSTFVVANWLLLQLALTVLSLVVTRVVPPSNSTVLCEDPIPCRSLASGCRWQRRQTRSR